MCLCKNIGFWTYENQITVIYNNKQIWVDFCLAKELWWLWKQWIRTVESCCGHNKELWYIAVREEHIGDMLSLGYEQEKHPDWLKNIFIPKYL